MRFKNIEEIIDRIENPLNSDTIKLARQKQLKHYLHLTGLGLDSYITQIEGLESKKLIELRQKLAKPATIPVMNNVISPINKTFTATGGSRWLNIDSEIQEKNFELILSNIKDGLSLDEFMFRIWKKNINLEPSSIAFIEISNKNQTNKPTPYITHKSIFDIYDIEYLGLNINYVIFEPSINEDGDYIYRVVDDESDWTIIKKTSDKNIEYKIDENNTYKNVFGTVPALAYSSKLDPLSHGKISYIDESIVLADEYLLDFTIYTIYKHKMGFPYVSQYPSACPECNGVGKLEDNTCRRCNGVGEVVSRDVSDIIIKPMPTKDNPEVGAIAEYTSPDLETWTKMEGTQDLFEGRIWVAVWNNEITKVQDQSKASKTAFEVSIKEDSKYTKLEEISTNKEVFEQKLIDLFASYYIKGHKGSQIQSGRIYLQRSSDDLWDEYLDSIKFGLPNHIKDEKLLRYLKTKYKGDPRGLNIAEKLFRSEPFPHIDLKEVVSLNPTPIEYQIKKLYQRYIYKIEQSAIGNSLYYLDQDEIDSKLNELAANDINKIESVNQLKEEDINDEAMND